MEIVFWQNMPSHHQSGAIRVLANTWHGDVYGIYDTEMLPDRKALGWQHPNMGPVKCFFLDQNENPALFVRNFIKKHSDAIHILGGFRGCLSVDFAWRELQTKLGARLVCIAERPRFDGTVPSKYLAKLWYRAFVMRFSHKFQALLTMGNLGVECYSALGFPRTRIYPFLYQVDGHGQIFLDESSSSDKAVLSSEYLKFIYIGRFDECKGVDVILDAFNGLPGLWKLYWVGGSGSLEVKVRNSADGDRVNFFGFVPSTQVISILQDIDVCLAPSRYDGWGMVTNESFLAGKGVVTSDRVGSSELVLASGAGLVIPAGNPYALRQALLDILSRPELVVDWAKRARCYRHLIAPEIIGQYLNDVLRYLFMHDGTMKPSPPWLNVNNIVCE